MAEQHAEFHSSNMDPHMARCLQLSTSISMPFNPYRQYRVPDHLNRSRFPVNMPQQQNRMMPSRTISYDDWNARGPTRAPSQPSYSTTANSHTAYPQHHGTPISSSPYTPQSAELGSSYFSAVPTPNIQESNDLWDEALNLDCAVTKPLQYEDFGLGLEPLGTDQNPMTLNPTTTSGFNYPGLLTEVEPLTFDPGSPEGRSWSSISDSSNRFVTDFSDFTAEPEAQSLGPDALITSLDSTPSSRKATSELPQRRFSKPTNRGVVESPPQARYRTSPYPASAGRSRSFSTGSVALAGPHRNSPYMHSSSLSSGFEFHQTSRSTASNSIPTMNGLDFDMFCQPQTSDFGTGFNHNAFFLPSSAEEPSCDTSCSSAHTSPEIVNVLHSSNPSRTECEHHFAGSSKPPDLFGPLQDDQLSPPPEDMNSEDSEVPRAQELRFEGDLYTPKYVRGHGNKREGWCGICKPGRWLVLKNSAFWYDKSFTHGISAATGNAFEGPKETRRMKGNPDVWEGLCHSCGDWIALISSKKKGTTWFRHAYKCHTHQKVKDTPKRRREVSHAKVAKVAKEVASDLDTRDESPYSLDSTLMSFDEDMRPSIEGISALQTISAII